MAPNLVRTTTAGSNSDAVHHRVIETDDLSDIGYQPQSGELLSNLTSDSFDGSCSLYTLYNEKTTKFDKELINNWMEHARDLMVLSGLVSAAIAAFLAQSYVAFLPTSGDVSAFWLAQIYQLQANLTNSSVPFRGEDIPSPISAPYATHILWFCGLGTSLFSALLATLLQSSIRRYVVMTQPQQSPRGRAIICAFMKLQGSLNSLQLVIDFLHLLLDIAIFTFLAGLVVLPSTTLDGGSFVAVSCITFPLFGLYLFISMTSAFHHTIHITPFFGVIRHIGQLVKIFVLRAKAPSELPPDHRSNAFLGFNWVMLNRVDQVADNLIEIHPLSLNQEVVAWLLRSFRNEQEFEHFLETIPGFYDSDLVKNPEQVFRPFHEDQVPRAILSFMHRTLSSVTLPDEIKQRRIRLSLQVVELDPHLLERTFFHALTLPARPTIFQCIDFVLAADRFSGKANASTSGNWGGQLLAKCILAVAVSYITAQESDVRWAHIAGRWLSFPLSNTLSDRQLASTKLDNLVWLAKELNSADSHYRDNIIHNTLDAASNFPVEDVESNSRSNFCILWNQLQDSAVTVPASLILPHIRYIYHTLHGLGVTDGSTRCPDPSHPPDPNSTQGAGTSVTPTPASGEDPAVTMPRGVTHVANDEVPNQALVSI